MFVRLFRVLAGLEERLGAVLLELVALALHLAGLLRVDVLGHPALVGRPAWAWEQRLIFVSSWLKLT